MKNNTNIKQRQALAVRASLVLDDDLVVVDGVTPRKRIVNTEYNPYTNRSHFMDLWEKLSYREQTDALRERRMLNGLPMYDVIRHNLPAVMSVLYEAINFDLGGA